MSYDDLDDWFGAVTAAAAQAQGPEDTPFSDEEMFYWLWREDLKANVGSTV